MVVSTNTQSKTEEFEELLKRTIDELNRRAILNPEQMAALNGTKLEKYSKDLMENLAIGSVFEGTIELISGQRFPDIVANKYFGVEVKTTTQDHWTTTGNSVLETTRVENVERIYMLFGKLGGAVEFASRLYQECLYKVVVTHSPRYMIDMKLRAGETIFDKMGTDYDSLRGMHQPIDPVVNYYRGQLKPGQDLWWINGEYSEEHVSDFVIEMWSNKSQDEKHEFRLKSMAFFPELFSNSGNKYHRMGIWLVKEKSVVCSSLRDVFSAGGREDRIVNETTYRQLPQVYVKLIDNFTDIIDIIQTTSEERLTEFWGTSVNGENKINVWLRLLKENTILSERNTEKLLFDLLQNNL